MDCRTTRKMLQEFLDGVLARGDAAGVRGHLDACPACAAEEASLRRVGEMLRLWSAGRVAEKSPQLDVLWTRVKAGIEEESARRGSVRTRGWLLKWAWIPAAAALAVLALLFYPSGVSRAPFHPKSFDVSVEDIESDEATVALVDRGEELPRVIWIIENEKT